MAAGRTPAVAPDAQEVPLYAAAGVNGRYAIGAFAGTPIADVDGGLFGTICGLDPKPQATALAEVEPLLLLLSRMLTVALVADRQTQDSAREALEARLTADVDALTGAFTRRAWNRILGAADQAFRQLGDPTAIVVVDLDELKRTNDSFGHSAGDELLKRAATAVASAVRSGDPVARLGGDEFGVLLRSCTQSAAKDRAEAIRASLRDAGVAASVGVASATAGSTLYAAQDAADRAMYDVKHRQSRSRSNATGGGLSAVDPSSRRPAEC
jgi:diguanylate cyclase (GGDEF)-like protein